MLKIANCSRPQISGIVNSNHSTHISLVIVVKLDFTCSGRWDKSPGKSLSSNKHSVLISVKLKSIIHTMAMEVKQSLEEKLNQLKGELIHNIKKFIQTILKEF